MRDLFMAMLVWTPATILPVVGLLIAPLASARARVASAVILMLGGVAALALASQNVGTTVDLEVINPFFDPGPGRPVRFVVETVRAPGWCWPVALAVYWLGPAAWLFARRHRPLAAPCPVTYASLVTVWTLAARLAFEKTGAPEPLTWAVGVTVPMHAMLPFVGWWAGRRGSSFAKLLWMLVLLGLAQRAMVAAVGYVATTASLGSHLDVGAIREVDLLLGKSEFRGPGDERLRQWVTLILIPQFMLWVPVTVVLGLVLGVVPFRIAQAGRHRPR